VKLPLLISALILVSCGLLYFAPVPEELVYSPSPEPQWVPDPIEVMFWRLNRIEDCLHIPRTDGVTRCPEFI
jgi:hypothetical protein